MVPFGGWEMPLQYASIVEEHLAVRKAAGLFDVSHMGDIMIRGPGARGALSDLLTNNVEALPVGKGIYGHLLDEEGRIIDDTIVYRMREETYLMVPNASTTERVLAWVRAHSQEQEVIDVSRRVACLALQGPRAREVLGPLTTADLGTMKRNSARMARFCAGEDLAEGIVGRHRPSGFLRDLLGENGQPEGMASYTEACFLCRTGYTGEDGFEILVESEAAPALWRVLLRAGEALGLRPCGLGARDTLRLEMGYLLSGTDFDGSQTSLMTGPPWVVKMGRDFIGKAALARQQASDDYPRLVGLEMMERGVPRHGYEVVVGGEVVGKVTSGTMSPCLRKGVALGYVSPPHHQEGTEVEIVIRGAAVKAKVAKLPFVRGC
jgi:aminomethyltransferase